MIRLSILGVEQEESQRSEVLAYIKEAKVAAIELQYDHGVLAQLNQATSIGEVERLMIAARKEKYED